MRATIVGEVKVGQARTSEKSGMLFQSLDFMGGAMAVKVAEGVVLKSGDIGVAEVELKATRATVYDRQEVVYRPEILLKFQKNK